MGARSGAAARAPELGCTPPPALYFSWQSYVFLRLRPRAYVPWAEYGDAINHLILNASGASSPWSSTTLVVTMMNSEAEIATASTTEALKAT